LGGPVKTAGVVLWLAMGAPAGNAGEAAGHYVLQGVREVGSELLLRTDGTFEYMLAYGAADYSATGKWRSDAGAVILTTAVKEQPPFRLVGSSSTQDAAVRIWVKAPNGRGVEHVDVVLRSADGEKPARTDREGAALFAPVNQPRAVKFRIPVYQFEAGPFELNPAHNDFRFEINGQAITQVRFQDERLTIEGSSLLLRYWNKDEPMRYVKQ
jgi:hypothetical protein